MMRTSKNQDWRKEGALLLPPEPFEAVEEIDWAALFGNPNPVEIEIGFGKGRFLIENAQANPDRNYLGIDYSLMCVRLAQKRIEKRNLPNALICRHDARPILHLGIPDESVAAYHILFPDPWPKKRHHKRRFFQPGNVGHLVRTLTKDGYVQAASDHAEYFCEQIRPALLAEPGLTEVEFSTQTPEEGRTNYEIKYIREGRTIHRAIYHRSK